MSDPKLVNVSEFRNNLAAFINDPLLERAIVLTHGKPRKILLDYGLYQSMAEEIEHLRVQARMHSPDGDADAALIQKKKESNIKAIFGR